jgi:hypothetical protein
MSDEIVKYEPEAWERQVDESWRDFEFFSYYRDSSPADRRFSRMSKVFGISSLSIKAISQKNRWESRLRLYQEMLDKERREIMFLRREQMYDRHQTLATALQEKLHDAISSIDATSLNANDIAKWADIAVKIDRLAHDTTTENIDNKNSVNVNVIKNNNTANVILDQKSAEVACDILERLTIGPIDSGGIRPLCIPGDVAVSEASSDIEQKTS